MKHALELRIGQSLTMTPQLQQAIRLLQLSTLELQAEIQEALESNPLLEIDDRPDASNYDGQDFSEVPESGDFADSPRTSTQDDFSAQDNSDSDYAGATSEDFDTRELQSSDQPDQMPDELPVDSQWDDYYDLPASKAGSDDASAHDLLDLRGSSDETLTDHLLSQLVLSPLSDRDKQIAISIIDAIGQDGFLEETLEEIQASLADELEDLELDEIEAVLRYIQQMEPVGIGARNLSECLLLQLQQMPDNTPYIAVARKMLQHYSEALADRNIPMLKRKLRVDESTILEALRLIQTLDPRPGSHIASSQAQYITPDVFVRKVRGKWVVELNPEIAPRLRINSYYQDMIKRADKSDANTYLRNNLQEARWFIKSLHSRNDTLMRVANAIVERQTGFFEFGEEGMKPLILRDIAELLELHESTISRVTTSKYMHTPRGVYEFKYFFSSHVSTADGGECSATAIRAMIKKLISEETPKKPLSDSQIASILVEQGINVARRTVAKYRESLNIPPSNQRKSLT